MLECLLYFCVSYALIFGIAFAAMRRRRRRHGVHAVDLALPLLLALPFAPYARVAILTYSYGNQFKAPVRRAVMELNGADELISFKILGCGDSEATFYVIDRCRGGADTGRSGAEITLHRTGATWQTEEQEDVRWSDCGSADGSVFPPYLDR